MFPGMRGTARSFRSENKYIVTIPQMELLQCRMEGMLLADDFVGSTGEYKIRSLYFDDYEGSSYRGNQIGVEPRSKFRIRIYDYNSDVVFLEQKIKDGGRVRKERARVDREFVESILEDQWQALDYPVESPVVNRFITAYYTRGLQPRIIIEYDRKPYVYPEGNVRVTFDKSISFSEDIRNFFSRDIFLRPIMDVGKELLEVKYSEFIPGIIYEGIHLSQLQQCTFSKYYLCETYRRNEAGIYDV